LKPKIVRAILALLLAAIVYVAVCVVLTVRSPIVRGDCGEHIPFAAPIRPEQAVFTAKILYVSGELQPPEWREPWSIALIRHRYWGLPWWLPNLVLLGHYPTKKGEEYFIDGDRSLFRLSGFFPYIDFRCGSRVGLLSESEVEIRLLKDGPPKSGVRIIGRVMRRSGTGTLQPVPRVNVKIASSDAAVATTTDSGGIYDAVGLPPGHYTVRADPDDEIQPFVRDHEEREGQLKDGDVWGRDVLVK
jgi:hypothetical protein